MIEFKKKFSMVNGNKVTKKNWHKVMAKSNEPCTGIHGVPEIELAKQLHGVYYPTYKLVYEKNDDQERCGYIFREIYAGTGINGHHKTFKEAIWWALSPRISVFIED